MTELSAGFDFKPEPWKLQSACIDADPKIFVPDQGVTTLEAKQYCIRCPVRPECEDYGRRTKSVGVWGGKLFTFRYAEPVELMPIRTLQDSRPQRIDTVRRDPNAGPSILGRVSSFSRPSILGR